MESALNAVRWPLPGLVHGAGHAGGHQEKNFNNPSGGSTGNERAEPRRRRWTLSAALMAKVLAANVSLPVRVRAQRQARPSARAAIASRGASFATARLPSLSVLGRRLLLLLSIDERAGDSRIEPSLEVLRRTGLGAGVVPPDDARAGLCRNRMRTTRVPPRQPARQIEREASVSLPCAGGGCSCGFAATQPMKIW